jgi:hypothetical protein
MLRRRPIKRPNERRILTLDLDEKPGDPHERRILTLDLDEKPGDPQMDHSAGGKSIWLTSTLTPLRTKENFPAMVGPSGFEPETYRLKVRCSTN